jgi:hypothetical protein
MRDRNNVPFPTVPVTLARVLIRLAVLALAFLVLPLVSWLIR